MALCTCRFIAQNRWLQATSITREARIGGICTRMRSEADFFDRIEHMHPGSVYRVRYEDVKADATTTVKKLFEFIGLEWSAAKDEQVRVAMMKIRGPRARCIGEMYCPLSEGPGGVTRARNTPWPTPSVCVGIGVAFNAQQQQAESIQSIQKKEKTSWDDFWNSVEAPRECASLLALGRYDWHVNDTDINAEADGDGAVPSNAGSDVNGMAASADIDAGFVFSPSAEYGTVTLTPHQLKTYALRFEAVVDESAAFAHVEVE